MWAAKGRFTQASIARNEDSFRRKEARCRQEKGRRRLLSFRRERLTHLLPSEQRKGLPLIHHAKQRDFLVIKVYKRQNFPRRRQVDR